MNRKITKIVITGGPCAGKTTALKKLQYELSQLGYTVLIVPETATELISGGIAPWTCSSNREYQCFQLRLQIEKEKIFEEAAKSMNAEKILIIHDRGILDNKAYMEDYEFNAYITELNSNEVELRNRYDAVFHMLTAAKCSEDFYTLANNSARSETKEQAIILDDKLIYAWKNHPYLRIIAASTDFEEKLRNLINELLSFLGEQKQLDSFNAIKK